MAQTNASHGPLLVTGGTGTLGSLVVPLLRAAGHPVRVLTRTAREDADGVAYTSGDLVADRGVDAAVEGVETVLHLAGGAKGDDVAARNLVRAAKAARVRHLVLISVIGADTVPLGWFRAKLEAERAVAGSGLPWTVLRAAQFHELAFTVAGKLAGLPVVPVPGGLRWQPVDSRDVAQRLAGLALGEPAGLVPDLAGPDVLGLGDLTRDYLRAHGRRRPMLPVRMPGKVGRAYRAGVNLSRDGALVGERTWEAFLAERVR
ncbi:SDR family oxidoreductase [Streptomyces lavendulae]|uniref:SDR family oxidoreductase n=1 Tax=Streptomyces lavendulae TaxID=1914 RepID=UPI0024A19DB5|nr:NmrA family transcriptional regulator [Streptomyces lavendulae subsp. lavendulae]